MRYKISRSPRLDRDELCLPRQVSLFTIGYVMDNTIGNSGGLGGVFGILYAVRPGSSRESLRHCGRRSFSRLHARYLLSRALARFLTCATGLSTGGLRFAVSGGAAVGDVAAVQAFQRAGPPPQPLLDPIRPTGPNQRCV